MRSLCLTLFLLSFIAPAYAKLSDVKPRIEIVHIGNDFAVDDLGNADWANARPVEIVSYSSGEKAPDARRAEARLLWSDAALYVRFEAKQGEPLVISDKPDLSKKTNGLWGRDVCEIFIAPVAKDRNRYFEFEIAPTGEWIDLGIHVLPAKRETDWEYHSGMTSAARIESDRVVMAIKVPWAALGKKPKAGDVWVGNLFRCIGRDPTRGYLSWQPTLTKEPAFHVPSKFGEFAFVM